MRRPYAGATARRTLAEVRQLGPRYAIQEKKDGCYVRIYLDSAGRVARAFSRTDSEVPVALLEGIRGEFIGWPHAELVGELEAHTEAGVKAAADRGQRLVHLFDMLHDGRRSLVREPYRARRDAMCRMQAEIECYGPGLPWYEDACGRSRSRRTRAYAPRKLSGWRVAPIVEQSPLTRLEALWEDVLEHDLEGLVVVNLDAPVGARCAKLKLKPTGTLDAAVVGVSRTTVTCAWNGHPFMVGRGRHDVTIGDVVEVRHAGWFAQNVTPRFPALVRVRRDLH